jgi:hypothetical protein
MELWNNGEQSFEVPEYWNEGEGPCLIVRRSIIDYNRIILPW